MSWKNGYFDKSTTSTTGFVIKIKKNNQEVGRIDLVDTNLGFYETHSFVEKEFRGMGLGIKLYALAFRRGFREGIIVKSTNVPSKYAKRVWKSKTLNSMFEIKRESNRWVVVKEKKHNHTA